MMQTISGPSMASSTPDSEILTEMNVEARTILAYQAPQKALEDLLPPEWVLTPPDTGPSTGANLNLIFSDRLIVQTADGRPEPGDATNQIAVLAAAGQNARTGARGVLILYGLSAKPSGAPGPYGVFSPADADVERILTSRSPENGMATERWNFHSENGDQIHLQLSYSRNVPVRSDTETRAYSAKNPDFYRIYRADQGAVILRSGATGTDSVVENHLKASGPLLGPLFDGTEHLVSITSIPWTVRRVFLPHNSAGSEAEDDHNIHQIIANMTDAWNRGDAKGWVQYYADDSDVIPMSGVVLVGRTANEKRHAAVFSGIFQGSTLNSEIRRIRYLPGWVAVVDTDLILTHYKSLPPGILAQPDGSLKMTMRHMLQKVDKSWAIVASQNTVVQPSQ
jgi:uncharacterized protein (TIGR02246 family)